MPPTRLGVIGAGLIWIRTHKPILQTMADTFEPVAFCEVSAERRAALAQEFPGARVVSEQSELLALGEVEAVLVLTPLALNAPTARAALQAGKHVIMEKPIARSVAEGRELIALARQAGRMLCVTEQMGYRRAEDLIAESIAAGEIGDLVVWERVEHAEPDTSPPQLRYSNTPWRKQADFPLGTMFDGGIHLIAGLSKLFGVPARVAASGRQLQGEYGEYDQVAALFEYEQGFSGILSHSTYLQPGRNHFHIYGSRGTITVEREQLIIEPLGQPARVVELAKENSYANMWRAIGPAFAEQREPFYTADWALNDVATLEAVSQAIKSGGRVSVERGS